MVLHLASCARYSAGPILVLLLIMHVDWTPSTGGSLLPNFNLQFWARFFFVLVFLSWNRIDGLCLCFRQIFSRPISSMTSINLREIKIALHFSLALALALALALRTYIDTCVTKSNVLSEQTNREVLFRYYDSSFVICPTDTWLSVRSQPFIYFTWYI